MTSNLETFVPQPLRMDLVDQNTYFKATSEITQQPYLEH